MQMKPSDIPQARETMLQQFELELPEDANAVSTN
jgi:hypothetical protein